MSGVRVAAEPPATVEVCSDVAGLASAWTDVHRSAARPSPFTTWEWTSSWWAAYGGGRSLLVLLVRRDGNLIGIAPLFQHTGRGPGLVRHTAVRLVGDGSFDSDYLDFISRAGDEATVVDAVLRWLDGVRDGWDVLEWNEIPADSPHLPHIQAALRARRFYVEGDTVPCSVVRLPTRWDDYVTSLKPRMRTKVRALLRDMEARRARLDVVGDEQHLPAALDSLFTLHHGRWKLKGQDGVFVGEPKRIFYRIMASAFLRTAALRFYSLVIDGAHVAHQLCITHGRDVYLLQEAFDAGHEEAGVGNALRALVFKDCIERGFESYDFLAGVTPHKLSWGAVTKASVRIAAGPRTLRNRCGFLLPRGVARVRALLAARLPRHTVDRLRRVAAHRWPLRRGWAALRRARAET